MGEGGEAFGLGLEGECKGVEGKCRLMCFMLDVCLQDGGGQLHAYMARSGHGVPREVPPSDTWSDASNCGGSDLDNWYREASERCSSLLCTTSYPYATLDRTHREER